MTIAVGRVALAATALAVVTLMGVVSLTRLRDFSPDSMSYVDVARNLVAGRGLSGSSLGFGRQRFSLDDPIPAPFTAHAPGFALLVAAVGLSGFRFTDAALSLPVVFLAGSLVAAFFVARACYDEPLGWLVVAVLLNYLPLRHVAEVAWSETTAIFFVLMTLWLLARVSQDGASPTRLFLVALCAGLAVSIRYPMAPIVGLAWLTVLIRRGPVPNTATRAVWLALGTAVGVGFTVGRNLAAAGSLAGSAPNVILTPVSANLTNTMWALTDYYRFMYLEVSDRLLALRLGIASLVVAGVVLVWQRRVRSVLSEVFVRRGAFWIGLWAVAYLTFLVVTRSITWFDDINHRLTAPAGVALTILWTVLIARTLRCSGRVAVAVAAILLGAAAGREVYFLRHHAPVARDVIPPTPRLLWIQSQTSNRDLIIGDYTMDVPFFLEGRRTIMFEHYPYTAKPTQEFFAAYLQRHCRDYDHVYLIVRDWHGPDHLGWRKSFGSLIADLVAGHPEHYPEYVALPRLADSYIFRITTPGCGR